MFRYIYRSRGLNGTACKNRIIYAITMIYKTRCECLHLVVFIQPGTGSSDSLTSIPGSLQRWMNCSSLSLWNMHPLEEVFLNYGSSGIISSIANVYCFAKQSYICFRVWQAQSKCRFKGQHFQTNYVFNRICNKNKTAAHSKRDTLLGTHEWGYRDGKAIPMCLQL